MPEFEGVKYPYTKEGMSLAKKAKKGMNLGKKDMLKKRTELGPKILRDRKTLKKSTNRDAVTKSNPMKGY